MRKACVETLVAISEMCEVKVKETTLTLLILKFLKDPNKYVRQATFTQLGPFIHGLSGTLISEKLIENFCQMAGEDDEEVF